jgi:hypothetical protein
MRLASRFIVPLLYINLASVEVNTFHATEAYSGPDISNAIYKKGNPERLYCPKSFMSLENGR